VRIAVAAVDGNVRLSVEDDGVGKVEGVPARGTGLGSRIVTAMATSLQAVVSYQARSPGTTATLTFAQKA
jgi:two-component sensor histidine kinase